MPKKYPLQVYLDAEQMQAIKNAARAKDASMADIVRESIARYLADIPVSEDPAMGIVGMGSSGRRDLARNHDRYLISALRRPSSTGDEVETSPAPDGRKGRRP